ncbi:MAG: hypothetical protein CL582_23340 [Alteromonadaceae bacterium]|nr:hypothetical protein [Alteromonadaceae bacterium]
MKARLKTSRTLPFFDALSEVADVNLFKVQVLDAAGTEVGVFSTSQVTGAPNLYLSAGVTPLTLGQHQIYYKYNDIVILHDTMEVGAEPISDFPIGTSVDIVLDDSIMGVPGQNITAHLYNSAGTTLSSTSFAQYTGSQAITTFAVSNNDQLTFQVLPDENTVGAQTITFLCSPAEVEGAVGSYGAGGQNDTATYQIDGAAARTLDLNGVTGDQASYIAALNAQLKGAYAADAGGGTTEIVTDSQGSGSSIVLSNLGGTFQANTGFSAGTYGSVPASNNVGNSDAVTFSELKLLIETTVLDSTQGDRVLVTLEAITNKLVLTAVSGTAGDGSQIDLQSGTASLLTSLGLSSLGTQGAGVAAQGSDGVSVQAPYDSSVDGYAIQNVTFSSEQEVFVVWHNSGVQSHMTSYYVTQPTDEEVVSITVGSLSGPNGTPHIGTTVTVSTVDGVQVAQGDTDIAGDLRLEIPPGDYIFTLSKSGFAYTTNNFTQEVYNSSVIPADPNLYSVAGDTGVQAMHLITEVFEPTVTSAPAPASMCTLYATLFRMDGTPVRHATVHVGLVHRPQLFSGTAVFDTQRVYKTDSNGYVEFSLVQGIKVEISIAPLSLRRRIDVPSSAGPTNLLTLLSGADDPFDIITPNIAIAPKRTI